MMLLSRTSRPLQRVRGRLYHTILQMADGDKVVQFEEDLTKTRQGGLRNKTRSSPLFEE